MIVIPTADDLTRTGGEASYFEANYPLFYITSSIISGPWNAESDIVTFYHVLCCHSFSPSLLSLFFLQTSRVLSSSCKEYRSITINVRLLFCFKERTRHRDQCRLLIVSSAWNHFELAANPLFSPGNDERRNGSAAPALHHTSTNRSHARCAVSAEPNRSVDSPTCFSLERWLVSLCFFDDVQTPLHSYSLCFVLQDPVLPISWEMSGCAWSDVCSMQGKGRNVHWPNSPYSHRTCVCKLFWRWRNHRYLLNLWMMGREKGGFNCQVLCVFGFCDHVHPRRFALFDKCSYSESVFGNSSGGRYLYIKHGSDKGVHLLFPKTGGLLDGSIDADTRRGCAVERCWQIGPVADARLLVE